MLCHVGFDFTVNTFPSPMLLESTTFSELMDRVVFVTVCVLFHSVTWITSKTVPVSGIVPCLQVNKLVCYCFMDIGRKLETSGSKTKDFVTWE